MNRIRLDFNVRDTLKRSLVAALLLGTAIFVLSHLGAPGKIAFAAGTITGTVFQDFNEDGVFNTTASTGISKDLHLAEVTVTAYDSAGTVRGSTTTVRCTAAATPSSFCTGADTGPNYSLSATGTGPYRIEFTWNNSTGTLLDFQPSSRSTDSVNGGTSTNSGSTTQFVADGNTSNVNLALNRSCDYCQNNAKLVTTRFENGLRTSNTNASIVSMAYNPGSHTNDAQIQNTGAVWGVGYDGLKKRAYTSAFLKRHVDLGPRGMDGVYVMDYSSGAGSLIGGFDLQGVTASNGGTIDLGTVTRGTNSDNTLGAAGSANIDLDAFAKVGKTGFGDIDFGNDNKSLWMVNLFQRTLVKVDTSQVTVNSNNPNTITTAAVNHYNIVSGGPSSVTISGAPSCTAGTLRPFGLKIRGSVGYLGVVCDAASSSTLKNPPELIGYVLSFSVSNPTSFTQLVSIPFTYNREPYYQMLTGTNTNRVDATWQRWMDTWNDANINTPTNPSCCADFRSAPSPMVSDIEVTPDGSLMIGVTDRFSHQSGWVNRKALAGDATALDYGSVGDILYAKYSGGTYTLEGGENDQGDPFQTVDRTGYRTDDSPGNAGEYFYGDAFTGNDATHGETTLGALAYMPGADRVFSPSYDPTAFYTQGLIWQPVTPPASVPGAQLGAYAVVDSSPFNSPSEFGKANGMGDMELLCDAAPIEIGNRVWRDDNGNGLQDPGETSLAGLTVQLWADLDNNGSYETQVGTATTDANGEYYFGGTGNTNMLNGAPGSASFSTRIAQSSDDAEQTVSTGTVNITSSTLNIPRSTTNPQLDGLRFQNVSIPQGATITSATIQFTANASNTTTTVNATIRGEAEDNAATFAATNNNISSRSTTSASTSWSNIGSWTSGATTNATTPDLTSIVQEIVNRGGWASGNNMSFIISDNSSSASTTRPAYSYDGSTADAALLTINYQTTTTYTVAPGTPYQVRIDPSTGSNSTLLTGLSIATQNAAQPANGNASATDNNPIKDVADSDATTSGSNYVINYTTGESGVNNHALDFGFAPPVNIGNLIWYDVNNNGAFDSGTESGINNVAVQLYKDTNGNGTFDSGTDTLVASTTTNSSGAYNFTLLTPSIATTDSTKYFVVLPNSNFTSGGALVGYQSSTNTDQANSDLNNNDHGREVGTLGTTTWIVVTQNSTNDNSGSVSLTIGGEPPSGTDGDGTNGNLTVDFGFYRLTVGNTIFRDDGQGGGTANNGTQDGTEPGISGVQVKLFRDADNDNVIDNGELIAVTTTDSNGNYLFTQGTDSSGVGNGAPLQPGSNYKIQIASGQSAMVGYQSSADGANAGTPMGADSDDNGAGTANANSNNTTTAAFTLSNGGTGNPAAPSGNTSTASTGTVNNPRVDLGFVPLFSIGNRVWRDNGASGGTANNGILDGGETGISGIGMSLYQDSNSDGIPDGAALQTTTTDGSSYYSFNNLPAGKYVVVVNAANFGAGQPLAGYYSSSGTQTGDKTDKGVDRGAGGQAADGIRSATITLGATDNAPTGSAETDFTTGQTQGGTQNGTTDGRANLQVDFGFQNSTPTAAGMGAVDASANANNTISLRWETLTELNIVGFNVLRSEARDGDYAAQNTEPISALSPGQITGNSYTFDDAVVEVGKTYFYRIEVMHTDNSTELTNPIQVSIAPPAVACKGKPSAPLALTPANDGKAGEGKIQFTWEAVNCAKYYVVEIRADSPDGEAVVTSKHLGKLQFTTQKLERGKTYYWRVLACNAKDRCDAGEWWSFKVVRKNKN